MKRLWIFDTDAANDATAATLLARLRRFTAYPIESLRSCQIYGVDTAANDSAADDTAADDTAAIDAALQHSDGERIRRENIDWQRVGALLFADRVTQHCLTQLDPQGPLPFDHCIEVRYQEGVTDPLGQAAQAALETYLRAHAPTVPPPKTVYSARGYLVQAALSPKAIEALAAEWLANPVIERITCLSKDDLLSPSSRLSPQPPGLSEDAEAVTRGPLPLEVPPLEAPSHEVPSHGVASHAQIAAWSANRGLHFSAAELDAIQAHFAAPETQARRQANALPLAPTAVEIETLAQTWSEHCKHKIFHANIRYQTPGAVPQRIQSLFDTYVRGATEKIIRQQPGKAAFCPSRFEDNAGVMRLDANWSLALKVETHNAPSAIDPYGGALTGILGVHRDLIGTGRGGRLLFNTDVFCFASPFHLGDRPAGVLHPRRVYEGVCLGVEHGGNKSGVPTVNGSLVFHASYLARPLVFCGGGALIPAQIGTQPGHTKWIEPGARVIMAGGRIGKDGIHGATFSSESLSSEHVLPAEELTPNPSAASTSPPTAQPSTAQREAESRGTTISSEHVLPTEEPTPDSNAAPASPPTARPSTAQRKAESRGTTISSERTLPAEELTPDPNAAPASPPTARPNTAQREAESRGTTISSERTLPAEEPTPDPNAAPASPPTARPSTAQREAESHGTTISSERTLPAEEPTPAPNAAPASPTAAQPSTAPVRTAQRKAESRGAVQIGDPFTQRKLADFIQEAQQAELFTAITDNGAGGLSSSVGEMALLCGGAHVDLAAAPLKYQGLQPWEIWVSESQERMTLACPPENLPQLQALAAWHDIEISDLGAFNASEQLQIDFQGQPHASLPLAFLHDGVPTLELEAHWNPPPPAAALETPHTAAEEAPDRVLLALLGRLNICSKESIIRRYDHEVQGGTVIKPLSGAAADGPSDGAVLRPLLDSYRGLAVAHGICPRYGNLDPAAMAACAVDEALRSLVALGADPDQVAGLDNFCWPDPLPALNNPRAAFKLGQLVRTCQGLHDTCTALGLPLISGKDSMKNDFLEGDDTRHAIIPTLLFTAVGIVPDVRRAVSMDVKQPGDRLYLLGRTRLELGESEYHAAFDIHGGCVPQLDPAAALKQYRRLHQAIDATLIRSAHDLSDGGLAVALAESAFAGSRGMDIDLSPLLTESRLSVNGALFSETPARLLISVAAENTAAFEARMTQEDGLVCIPLGEVKVAQRLLIRRKPGAPPLIDLTLRALKEAWQAPLRSL